MTFKGVNDMATQRFLLSLALDTDDIDAVQKLLAQSPELLTPYWLHSAAHSGALRCVQHMIQLGLDVNVPKEGEGGIPPEGPLFPAEMSGNVELIRWLLEQGARSEVFHPLEGVYRSFAFESAVSDNRIDMVRLMVQHGTNVNIAYQGSGPYARTPLDCAGYPEMREYLRSVGAKTAIELGLAPPPAPDPAHNPERKSDERTSRESPDPSKPWKKKK
jgi:hypothetical protein